MSVETLAADLKNGFDISDALIPKDLIKNGGPGKDGIPAIDAPRFVTAQEDRFLNSADRVMGVTVNGISKAYPIKILDLQRADHPSDPQSDHVLP